MRFALEGIREPVAVFGIGVEGRSVVGYLARHGVKDISALDRKEIKDLPDGVKSIFGQEHDQGLERFKTVFRSPGIRPDHPGLVAAREAGAAVTSAIQFFLERCPCPVVGVTGTLGKGTSASLCAAMLEQSGFDTRLGGNIGASPLEFLDDLTSESRVVLELSSFQCMDLTVSPHVAVVLKTTSEHLDWHVDHNEYISAKANLLANQGEGDVAVYNADVPGSCGVASGAGNRVAGGATNRVAGGATNRVAGGATNRLAYSISKEVDNGIFFSTDKLVLRNSEIEQILDIDINKVRLPGVFNLENVAAALLGALTVGCDLKAACVAAETFVGLPHRVAFVAESGGISFYNDSYATRPDATLGALTCFSDKPLAIILGGSEKHADFEELARALLGHPTLVKACLIGATAGRLAQIIDGAGERRFDVEEYDNLEPAVDGGTDALPGGGVVLLSPACASFGLFPNYKVRGERFIAKATELALKLGRDEEFPN